MIRLIKSKAHILLPLLIIFLVGAGVQYFRNRVVEDLKNKVVIGEDYYVQPTLLEVSPNNSEGTPWDSIDSTGPDLYIEIYWQGQRVFKSSTKSDSLLARWSNAEVDIRNFALTGKRASVDDVIPAARINVRESDSLQFKVFDRDLLGSDELIAEIDIPTSQLFQGEVDYADKQSLVMRLVLKVFHLSEIPDLTSRGSK